MGSYGGGDTLKSCSKGFEENGMVWAERKQEGHKEAFPDIRKGEQMTVSARE